MGVEGGLAAEGGQRRPLGKVSLDQGQDVGGQRGKGASSGSAQAGDSPEEEKSWCGRGARKARAGRVERGWGPGRSW